MIDIKIGLYGKPNINKILLGNKYENNDEIIRFDFDDSLTTWVVITTILSITWIMWSFGLYV